MKQRFYYRLIAPNGSPYETSTPGTLGGHRKNRIYGKLDCRGALSWIRKGHYVKQRVFFASESDAIKAGYRPCSNCMRADFLEWKDNPTGFRIWRVTQE